MDRPTTPSNTRDDTNDSASPFEPSSSIEANPRWSTRSCRSFVATSSCSQPQTVRQLVANFADPHVGAASGELVITPGDETAPAGHGAALYWRYEKAIRSAEGRVDSTIGATGAIYAIRRALFEPIPEDTLLDDVLIPLRVVRRGYRVVF